MLFHSNLVLCVLLHFFLFSFPSAQTCTAGRLTQYPIGVSNNIPQGTCNFGSVYNLMPAEFKSGRIIAANQDYYNGFKTALTFTTTCTPQNGTSCGLNCGQCILVTGAKGSATFIMADIGDYPTVGIEDAGDMTEFGLNNINSDGLKLVADSPGYEVMDFKPVPCATTGNLGFYFPESGSNKWSVALTFYNHKVPIQKVEIKSNNPQLQNQYIQLPRDWTNKFVWRGTQNYTGQSGDIYNGGTGFQIRITSVFNEVIETNQNYSIPTTNIVTTFFDLGSQFNVSNYGNNSACQWSGPTATIYNGTVVNRKYNSNSKNFDTCLEGSSGCKTIFAGNFMVEWFLLYQSSIPILNLQSVDSQCLSSHCILVQNTSGWGLFAIAFSSNFNQFIYGNVTFSAKLAQNSTLNTTNIGATFDTCNQSASFIANKNWGTYTFQISNLSCPTYIRNLKFVFGSVDNVFLDKIYLTAPNGTMIDTNNIESNTTSNTTSNKTTFILRNSFQKNNGFLLLFAFILNLIFI